MMFGAWGEPDHDTSVKTIHKIRAFGSSTFPAHQMVQAQWVSERRGLGAVRDRAAALLPVDPWHRGRRPARGDGVRDAGISLIHLALAFVLQHPAVTATIIGPRTLEHLESQLGATDVTLSGELLDEIDRIVAPGVTIARADQGYQAPSLTDPFLRRRRTA